MIVFFIKINDHFSIANKLQAPDIAATGEIGDFIGGLVGTLFSLVGVLLLFITLRDQRESFKKERFENHFFELIKLHRENVSELNYKKFDGREFITSENRKVMRDIFNEFIECYRDVKKFSNSNNPDDYLNTKYKLRLENIKKEKKFKANIIELAIIDISYSIVFFGVGLDGESVLRNRFQKKYNSIYYYRLLAYIKLKPKRENRDRYELWENMKSLDLKNLRKLIEEVYVHRKHLNNHDELSEEAKKIISDNQYEKYYGGHQHRLGHYFRHLFQSYKFLSESKFINSEQKYFYGKTFRAQLSTYEQALLFINSISSLGMKWEYKFEFNERPSSNIEKENGLITEFHLIKNLPGNHFFGIKYKNYYPRVKYENNED
ncbi:MAG TPA: putative phage abortive infection protein [Puia sp.]|nr:putative phage abortive infection protein [Puia sp.]